MKFVSHLGWIAACCTALLMAGCAGGPNNVRNASNPNGPAVPAGATAGGRGDIVTESDEPDNRRRARLRLELASGYFGAGQTNVALDELKQSLAADPNFGEAYNLRGLVYLRLNDIPLAEESFRRSLALNPRDADAAHNYGWMLCQQSRFAESFQMFGQAIGNPTYAGQAKSLMAQGICQQRAGQPALAEQSLVRAYELDAGNPVTAYNLANLLYLKGDYTRAQFYIRRLNSGDLANAETLWLGSKIEQRLGNREATRQFGEQLKLRYPTSREASAYERGMFNE
ncbi:MAG: type IV pilus biogenesis/stability protein PilW [Comamonadaceae bacterium]|nr:MAG: type IV pilus biogenesis/stability protein PilW [Comamonadaceae bacterium]